MNAGGAPVRVLHVITRLIVGGAQENTMLTAERLNRGWPGSGCYRVDVVAGTQTGPEGSLIEEVRARCATAGRDPATLRFSMYVRDDAMRPAGSERSAYLAELAATGLDRIVCFPGRWDPTVEGQARFADDCRAAGIALGQG